MLSDFHIQTRARLVSPFGVCLVSAASSIPLHFLPFILEASISGSTISLSDSGWISAALFSGILLSSVAIGIARPRANERSGVLLVSASVISGAVAATKLGFPLLLSGWFLIGTSCGLLSSYGNIYAGLHRQGAVVLKFRLSIVLAAAGIAILAATPLAAHFGYSAAVYAVITMMLVFVAIGCFLLRLGSPFVPMANEAAIRDSSSDNCKASSGARSIIVAIVFYLGQLGYIAYAAHLATERGISLPSLMLAFAGCKIIASLLLGWSAIKATRLDAPLPKLSLAIGASILLITKSPNAVFFAVGLLLWECCVNMQSALLQASVVRTRLGGYWLSAAIACGVGLGPPVHGFFLKNGLGMLFVAFAIFSSFAPLLLSTRATLNKHPNSAIQ